MKMSATSLSTDPSTFRFLSPFSSQCGRRKIDKSFCYTVSFLVNFMDAPWESYCNTKRSRRFFKRTTYDTVKILERKWRICIVNIFTLWKYYTVKIVHCKILHCQNITLRKCGVKILHRWVITVWKSDTAVKDVIMWENKLCCERTCLKHASTCSRHGGGWFPKQCLHWRGPCGVK